jgi:predicted transcriptional regulator
MNGIEDGAMRLLRATREQLHGKPTRQVEPCGVAEKVGINPYSREYETTMRYLIDQGYIEPYSNSDVGGLGLYRVTNKGLEEILSSL